MEAMTATMVEEQNANYWKSGVGLVSTKRFNDARDAIMREWLDRVEAKLKELGYEQEG